ncbi:MAG: 50S ribosomal protein L24 [Proteobacteria bacterium]|nr:50S ribosomal protein L24 [Pseudomonadota bacterium]
MKAKSKKGVKPVKKKLLLKKDDVVQVICGKDKGSTGKILNVDRYRGRVVVEGVNMVTKHVKPKQAGQEGRIEKFEAPIDYSNVLLYCKDSGKGERLRIRINDDNTKTRIFAKSGTPAD